MKTRLKALFALCAAAGGMIPAAGAKRPETAAYVSYGGDAAATQGRDETARAAAGDRPTTDTLYCRRGLFREHNIAGWNQYPIHIADSLLIEHTQDGPWPSLFGSFERVEEGHYRFTARGICPDGTGEYDRYVIDPIREIALLEEHLAGEPLYRLLIAARKACLFDLLVWHSAEMPAGNEIRKAGAETFRRWIETFHSKQTPSK